MNHHVLQDPGLGPPLLVLEHLQQTQAVHQVHKPLSNHYPTALKTIGDHIRKRRLDLGLFQREVADRIGAMKDSISLWEANRVAPTLPFLPKIIEFLGYSPYDPAWTPGERLIWIRRYIGLSQETMARRLRVDPGTLAKLEQGKRSVPEKVEKQFLLIC